MTVPLDFTVPVPTRPDELRLVRAIEAGVLAADLRRRMPGSESCPPRRRRRLSDATADELDALIREGELAWSHMVAGNLRLVTMVTGPFGQRPELDADELFQEGALGLMEALRRFDHSRGARFATFALPWIRMRVADAAATRCGGLPIPANRARDRIRVKAVENALYVGLGRTPSAADIAHSLSRPEEWVRGVLDYRPPVSLEVLNRLDGDEPTVPPVEDRLGFHRMLRWLSGQERAVIERRFGLGNREMTYAEVADELGISTSTVRRRERTALDRLRRCADIQETMAG